MSKKEISVPNVLGFKELVVALTEKNCRVLLDGDDLAEVVQANPTAAAGITFGFTKWKTVEKLLERMQPGYLVEEKKVHGLREAWCQFPSEGPCNYVVSNDDAEAMRYEVELRYKHRPNDPIED